MSRLPDVRALLDRVSLMSLATASGVALVLLAAVVLVDLQAAPDLSLVIFYLLPVVLMAWVAGARVGVLSGLVVGGIAFLVALVDQRSGLAVTIWNAGARTLFYVFTAWLVAEVHVLLVETERIAATDGLTGLLNRRAFHEQASQVCARARRQREVTSLVYLDLDDLKVVNDAQGHEAGDRLILAFAELVGRVVRSYDLVGRLGGDEFAVLLPDTDRSAAAEVVGRLLEALSSAKPNAVRASVGVAVADQAPADIDQLLLSADRAMYVAKEAGGANAHLCDGVGPQGLCADGCRDR